MEEKKQGGIKINKEGLFCLACRCKKNLFRKSKKILTEESGKIIVEENIETCSLGFGNREITPPIQPRTLTIEQRIEILENKIDKIMDEKIVSIEKEVSQLKQNTLNGMD